MEPRILINGAALSLPEDQRPRVVNGLTLIPMRAIFEALGATIAWDAPTSTVTGTRGATVVTITLDAPEATVNGNAVRLAQPAQLIGGRITYVPLRFVSESLGARVGWDGETATIRISDRRPAVGGSASLPVNRLVPSLLDHTSGTFDRLIRALYGDGLLRHHPANLQLEPALAAAMPTVSADGRTYTFRLRKGVTFHDGTEVTARDFVYTLTLASGPNQIYPFSANIPSSWVESISAPDATTLVIRVKSPNPSLINRLAATPPLPSHLLAWIPQKDLPTNAFWQAPVGAGPFRVAGRTDNELTLARYPDFWEAKINPEVGPWLETLHFRVPKSSDVRLLFLMGELDLYEAASSEVADLKKLSSVAAYEYGRNGHGYFVFNTVAYPTNIVQVRQALSLAFNREQVVTGLMGGQATVPSGPIPDFHWTTDPQAKPPAYDPARAVALLEQAGFTRGAQGLFEKDGKPLTVQLYFSTGSSLLEGLGMIAQRSWEKIGVKTEVIYLDFNDMMDNHLKPGRYHVSFSGFSLGPDPYSFLADVWSSNGIRLDAKGNVTGYNRARYRSAAFDVLVGELSRATDPAQQRTLVQQAGARLLEDAPAIWVYSNQYTDFVSKWLKGVVVRNGYGVGRPEYWYRNEQP